MCALHVCERACACMLCVRACVLCVCGVDHSRLLGVFVSFMTVLCIFHIPLQVFHISLMYSKVIFINYEQPILNPFMCLSTFGNTNL